MILLNSCGQGYEKNSLEDFKVQISGEAQGTTWQIVYYDLQERNFKPQIDSILKAVDQSISTYLPGSLIDQWNKSDSGIVVDQLFLDVLKVSRRAYENSNGAFDPTIKPLVSYWGFGPELYAHPEKADQLKIDTLLQLVNFDTLLVYQNDIPVLWHHVLYSNRVKAPIFLEKPLPEMQLDFNAVGQGWSVDLLADFLEQKGIRGYFVEVGGEIRAGHPKPDGSLWKFGIDKPIENLADRELQAIINLRNKGLATSGSYRKFYEKDGVKFSHTIDPKSGYPVQHSLLSATVVSRTAGDADAMATAFMVMGTDSVIEFLNSSNSRDEVFLIYNDNGEFKTFASEGVNELLTEVE